MSVVGRPVAPSVGASVSMHSSANDRVPAGASSPRQVRIAVAAEAVLAVARAHREVGRDRLAVFEAVAVDFHAGVPQGSEKVPEYSSAACECPACRSTASQNRLGRLYANRPTVSPARAEVTAPSTNAAPPNPRRSRAGLRRGGSRSGRRARRFPASHWPAAAVVELVDRDHRIVGRRQDVGRHLQAAPGGRRRSRSRRNSARRRRIAVCRCTSQRSARACPGAQLRRRRKSCCCGNSARLRCSERATSS